MIGNVVFISTGINFSSQTSVVLDKISSSLFEAHQVFLLIIVSYGFIDFISSLKRITRSIQSYFITILSTCVIAQYNKV